MRNDNRRDGGNYRGNRDGFGRREDRERRPYGDERPNNRRPSGENRSDGPNRRPYGENRSDRARLPGRFVLEESSSTVFSAKIFGDSIDRNGVESRFHIIYAEWGSGSV